MTNEIAEVIWEPFLDQVSKQRYGWKTKIEVMNSEIGDQTLEQGLPLKGLTLETHDDESTIEIMVGERNSHQTHNIKNPVSVTYFGQKDHTAGVLEIEESDGTKTLVHFLRPLPLCLDHYEQAESVTA